MNRHVTNPTHHALFDAHVQHLQWRLARPLPGLPAMMAMAPSARTFVPVEAARAAGCREACTLVLLYPIDGRVHTVLTLRSGDLQDHAGQVSLPGGQIDPGEDLATCALREAGEELGIAADAVRIIGRLTPIYIAPSDFCVSPVMAAASRRPEFRSDGREVAEVIELPLDRLLDPAARRIETWDFGGTTRDVPFFAVGGHKIWGATAMVLSELATVWSEVTARGLSSAGER